MGPRSVPSSALGSVSSPWDGGQGERLVPGVITPPAALGNSKHPSRHGPGSGPASQLRAASPSCRARRQGKLATKTAGERHPVGMACSEGKVILSPVPVVSQLLQHRIGRASPSPFRTWGTRETAGSFAAGCWPRCSAGESLMQARRELAPLATSTTSFISSPLGRESHGVNTCDVLGNS